MNKSLLIIIPAILLSSCTATPQSSIKLSDSQIAVITPTENIAPSITNSPTPMSQKITAIIHTSMGDIKINLFPDKAPNTVANFVGLSKGTKDWTNSQGEKVSGTPLYQNVIFHRVIENFMIQGGDPLGSGMGGPGYKFADEPVTDSYLRGTLAMANSGPNTNGSQFFIVHKDYPLPKNYTIFGRVEASDSASLAILDRIASTPTDPNDRPKTDIVIKNIDIIEE